jgi:hypothetical protein
MAGICLYLFPGRVGQIEPNRHLAMAVTDAQKAAVEQVIQAIKSVSSPRKKRVLADLFLDLVDKDAWADYYQVTSVHPSPCRSVPSTMSNNRSFPSPGVSMASRRGSRPDPTRTH